MIYRDRHVERSLIVQNGQGDAVLSARRRAFGVRFTLAVMAHIAPGIHNRAGDRNGLAVMFVMRHGHRDKKEAQYQHRRFRHEFIFALAGVEYASRDSVRRDGRRKMAGSDWEPYRPRRWPRRRSRATR